MRNKMISKTAQCVAFGIALSAVPTGASAKNSMTINAKVTQNCNIFATPMIFGTVSLLFPSSQTQATMTIDCTPGTNYTVTIDNGQNYNGQRRMARAAGGLFLNYEIYRNPARTQRWGPTVATGVSGTAPPSGKVTLVAYGQTSGFLASGAYEDTVTVTIAF